MIDKKVYNFKGSVFKRITVTFVKYKWDGTDEEFGEFAKESRSVLPKHRLDFLAQFPYKEGMYVFVETIDDGQEFYQGLKDKSLSVFDFLPLSESEKQEIAYKLLML